MTKSYVRTATRTTLKVEENLTQILDFKANFHTEFEPFVGTEHPELSYRSSNTVANMTGGNCPTTTTAGNTSREFRLLTRSSLSIQPLNQTQQRIIFARSTYIMLATSG